MSLVYRENRNRLTQIMLLKSLLQVSLSCPRSYSASTGGSSFPGTKRRLCRLHTAQTSPHQKGEEGAEIQPVLNSLAVWSSTDLGHPRQAGHLFLIFTKVPYQLPIALSLKHYLCIGVESIGSCPFFFSPSKYLPRPFPPISPSSLVPSPAPSHSLSVQQCFTFLFSTSLQPSLESRFIVLKCRLHGQLVKLYTVSL